MENSYVLSYNKQNERSLQKITLKHKIDYKQRQRYRSKSPLGQQSLNRSNYNRQQNPKSPLNYKKDSKSFKYIQQSYLKPSTHVQNTLSAPYAQKTNFNKQCQSDLSKIKPFSMIPNFDSKSQFERTNKQQSRLRKNYTNKQNQNDKSLYNLASKSRQRQNSKHLQFSAKVNNLKKINNQITSLLDYVKNPKLNNKDQKSNDQSLKYKPRYDNYGDKSKTQAKKTLQIQKDQTVSQKISQFDAKVQEKYDNWKKPQNYQVEGNIKNSVKTHNAPVQSVQRNTPRQRNKKIYLLQNQNLNSLSSKQFNRQTQILKPFPSVKSQQLYQKMIPSQFQESLSKITANHNQDLQFYYESLKKRDQQIDRFKKKLFDSIDKNKLNKKSQKQIKSQYNKKQNHFQGDQLAEKYMLPLKRNNLSNQDKFNDKKDIFVTRQQIQICKDINRYKRNQNLSNNCQLNQNNIDYSRTIRKSRKPQFAQKGQNKYQQHLQRDLKKQIINKQIPTSKQDYKCPKSPRSPRQYKKNQLSYSNNKRSQLILLNKGCDTKYNYLNDVTDQQPTTKKLDEQINKIKNQLKDCNREKYNLRQKYAKLLDLQEKQLNQKTNTSQVLNKSQRKDSYSLKKSQQIKNRQDKYSPKDYRNPYQDMQRIYESYNNSKNQFQPQIIQFQNNHRSNLKQQLSPKYVQNFIAKTQQYIEAEATQKYKQPCYNQEQIFQSVNLIKNSHLYENLSPRNRQLTQNSSRVPRNFQIKLQKVEITKPQTTKLGTILSQKIQLDFKLRQERQKFTAFFEQSKWQKLKSYLQKKYSLIKSAQQWQELLKICPQQHNPFSNSGNNSNKNKQSKPGFNNSMDDVINSMSQLLYKSLSYFQNNLLHKFSGQQLKKENFSFKQLDLNSKGYLSLEDLICFVNLHSGKFYRNRDIIFTVKQMIQSNENKNCFNNRLYNEKSNGNLNSNSDRSKNNHKLQYQFLWNFFVN